MLKISIIIPCYNEELYISNCIDSIISSEYPIDQMELILVDGMSTDKTYELIEGYCQQYSFIKVFKNKKRIVSYALNLGIMHATGDYIVRLDAHCLYPKNYLSRLVEEAIRLKADNVGGLCRTLPADTNAVSQAIAIGFSHPLGVGNSLFRIGCDSIQEVDTVPFGCFPRNLFNRIGNFDVELVRNQDDEFNARIRKNGGKIFIIPDLVIDYFARNSLRKSYLMFYQYGLFKPLVNKKIGGPASVRQFIPLLFVVFLITGVFFSFFSPLVLDLTIVLMFSYLLVTLIVAFKKSVEYSNFLLMFLLPMVFFSIHFGYGWGYIRGIFKFRMFRNNSINKSLIVSNR